MALRSESTSRQPVTTPSYCVEGFLTHTGKRKHEVLENGVHHLQIPPWQLVNASLQSSSVVQVFSWPGPATPTLLSLLRVICTLMVAGSGSRAGIAATRLARSAKERSFIIKDWSGRLCYYYCLYNTGAFFGI